ncbi:uncharacterized protein LOC142336566 [Convolutriloba macropyga]|uniref:uncharacterized protein LOC142336566 n=1 Tax=Convolutriloba macropyga TaxID=536237 RepID=UPI003F527B76
MPLDDNSHAVKTISISLLKLTDALKLMCSEGAVRSPVEDLGSLVKDLGSLVKDLGSPVKDAGSPKLFEVYARGCCDSQIDKYETCGQEYGLSPFMYLEKLTNFNATDKKLNHLQARFSRELCLNVITSVGFGSGELKRIGYFKRDSDFLIVNREPMNKFSNNLNVHRISYKKTSNKLTFNFFRNNFICNEQPWLCNQK